MNYGESVRYERLEPSGHICYILQHRGRVRPVDSIVNGVLELTVDQAVKSHGHHCNCQLKPGYRHCLQGCDTRLSQNKRAIDVPIYINQPKIGYCTITTLITLRSVGKMV